MFDLSKEPYAIQEQSVSAIVSRLKATLPPSFEVTLKEVKLKKGGKTPAIQISDGLWRGALLIIQDTNQQLTLTNIIYKIPTFAAQAIVLIGTCLALSVIFTLVASVIAGQFVPVGALGGFIGVMLSENFQGMIARNVRDSSWAVELNQAIEGVNTNAHAA
jgi:hypothetical protein